MSEMNHAKAVTDTTTNKLNSELSDSASINTNAKVLAQLQKWGEWATQNGGGAWAWTYGNFFRDYFCFYDYEYVLDVSKQNDLMTDTIPLEKGLKEEFEWYKNNLDSIYNRKPYMEYIDNNLVRK